jgi:hypothetical protein
LTWLRSEDRSHPDERRRGHGPSRRQAVARPRLEMLEERRVLSTLTVTSSNGGGGVTPGDGTLPGEILAADADPNPADDYTIVFDPSLKGQTITLGGQLEIARNLTIQGPGAGLLAVSGNNVSRVFQVDVATVTISGLTIDGGNASYDGNYPGTGGAILNRGTLSLSGCTVTGNNAATTQEPSKGGGIANLYRATMTLSGCTITGNVSGYPGLGFGEGGGIYNDGTMTLSGCAVTNNTCIVEGGGIYNDTQGHLTILSSVVKKNKGDDIYSVGWIDISKDSSVGKVDK